MWSAGTTGVAPIRVDRGDGRTELRQVNVSIDETTLRRIAEKIEYSPTAIYVHFKDKLDLLMSICRADFGAFGQMLGELQSVADPIEHYLIADFSPEGVTVVARDRAGNALAERDGLHPTEAGYQRMADEFFRPYFAYGTWASGEIMPGLWYNAMTANNSSSLGVKASQLDRTWSTGAVDRRNDPSRTGTS